MITCSESRSYNPTTSPKVFVIAVAWSPKAEGVVMVKRTAWVDPSMRVLFLVLLLREVKFMLALDVALMMEIIVPEVVRGTLNTRNRGV